MSYCHRNDVIMGAIASQITSLTIVYSTVYTPLPQRPEGARTLTEKQICNFMDLLVACHPQMSSAYPPTSVPWVAAQTDVFRSSKIVRWQKLSGFEIRHRTFAPTKFRANGGLPPIAPSTFRWFRLPTGHRPATLPCDAVESPTTRQIGDSPVFNRIVIGV